MADAAFRYSDLLPTGADDTPYRPITTEGVSAAEGCSIHWCDDANHAGGQHRCLLEVATVDDAGQHEIGDFAIRVEWVTIAGRQSA